MRVDPESESNLETVRQRLRQMPTPVNDQWPILLHDDILDYFWLQHFLQVLIDERNFLLWA